jgi:hypothetical protein
VDPCCFICKGAHGICLPAAVRPPQAPQAQDDADARARRTVRDPTANEAIGNVMRSPKPKTKAAPKRPFSYPKGGPMSTTYHYQDFLRAKADFERDYGQPVDAAAVNPILKEHQRDIVRWAVEGGRRAIFAAFGMGKSIMQLETLRLTLAHAGGRALIIAPLGVRGEFIRDGRKLGVEVKFIRRAEDMAGDGIYITNYETVRDGKLDVEHVHGRQPRRGRRAPQLRLQDVPDLPDPVRGRALPVRCHGHAITEQVQGTHPLRRVPWRHGHRPGAHPRFFQRDSTQANNLTLYPHKREEFFMWLNSWSIFLQKPSDLGYSDEGYDLPPLTIDWVEVPVDHSTAGVDRDGQVRLFRGGAKDLQGTAKEKRDSLPVASPSSWKWSSSITRRTTGRSSSGAT